MFFREFPGKSNQSKHGRNLTQEHRTTLLAKCVINKPVFATPGGGHCSCSVPRLYSWVNQERQGFFDRITQWGKRQIIGGRCRRQEHISTTTSMYLSLNPDAMRFSFEEIDMTPTVGSPFDYVYPFRLDSPSVQQQNRRKKLTPNSG